jgi:hypothetical protein
VWSIRSKLQVVESLRDLAMFNVAIDSKLRGCDVMSLKVEDIASRKDRPRSRDRSAKKSRLDAKEYLYGFEASWDYDPEPNLAKIKARLLTFNFADDMADVLELALVERAVARIPNARSVIVPASDKSHGHFGSRYPELWKPYLVELLGSLSEALRQLALQSDFALTSAQGDQPDAPAAACFQASALARSK